MRARVAIRHAAIRERKESAFNGYPGMIAGRRSRHCGARLAARASVGHSFGEVERRRAMRPHGGRENGQNGH